MFTGVDFRKAYEYWAEGKEVIVLDRGIRGQDGKAEYDISSFGEIFKDLEFLVDLPAAENPESREAAARMAGQKMDEEGDTVSPPSKGRK